MSEETAEQALYLDTSRPFAERVKDLVGRLTLDEKVSLMIHPAQSIPRLDIPGYNYWSEALHGVDGSTCKTPSFLSKQSVLLQKHLDAVEHIVSSLELNH